MPYLIDNPEVGYVQTRWVFVNPDESYLTKARAQLPAAHSCIAVAAAGVPACLCPRAL